MEIRNINDFAESLGTTVSGLHDYFKNEHYPVTMMCSGLGISLTTDADRVPFTKTLWYPFTDEDYDNAISGLMCVTDYAMHEGYEKTHKDLYEDIALRYAEKHGIYEYKVNGTNMEYWSLYDQGFYFYIVDLDTLEKTELAFLPWTKSSDYKIPAFLRSETGAARYNYFEG